jgi:hypothetical protein
VKAFGAIGPGRVDESVAQSFPANFVRLSEPCKQKTSPGAHRESMENSSNSDLIYLKLRSPRTWRSTESRRLKVGVAFSQVARELR